MMNNALCILISEAGIYLLISEVEAKLNISYGLPEK